MANKIVFLTSRTRLGQDVHRKTDSKSRHKNSIAPRNIFYSVAASSAIPLISARHAQCRERQGNSYIDNSEHT